MSLWLEIASTSLAVASTYALIGLAWVVVFKGTHVFNFATGQVMVVGALLFATMYGDYEWSFATATLITLVLIGAANALVYRTIVARAAGQDTFTSVIITLGVASVSAGIVLIVWGQRPRVLSGTIENDVHRVGDAVFTSYGLIQLGLAVAVFVLLFLGLRYTRVGIRMRAAAENPLLAGQSGIAIQRVGALSWIVAAVALTIAGVAFGFSNVVTPGIEHLALLGIAPALLGGLDSIGGVVIGALMVATVETTVAVQFGAPYAEPAVFALLLLVIIVRPSGLFGTPAVRRI